MLSTAQSLRAYTPAPIRPAPASGRHSVLPIALKGTPQHCRTTSPVAARLTSAAIIRAATNPARPNPGAKSSAAIAKLANSMPTMRLCSLLCPMVTSSVVRGCNMICAELTSAKPATKPLAPPQVGPKINWVAGTANAANPKPIGKVMLLSTAMVLSAAAFIASGLFWSDARTGIKALSMAGPTSPVGICPRLAPTLYMPYSAVLPIRAAINSSVLCSTKPPKPLSMSHLEKSQVCQIWLVSQRGR